MGERAQGRPTRGSNEVGRNKIIERFRDMMREAEFDDFSRKNLAKYSGVTPALITYYFPDRTSLIEQTTKPLIEKYLIDLRAILRADKSPDERLREVIRLLIKCYSRDGKILGAYRKLVREGADNAGPDYIALMSQELSAFFDTLMTEGAARPHDAEVLQSAVWGMCEFVAQRNVDAIDHEDEYGSEADVAVRLFDLITLGLGHWQGAATPAVIQAKIA